MKFSVEHENRHRLRIKLKTDNGKLNDRQCDIIKFALIHMKGVSEVKLLKNTSNVMIRYNRDKDYILQRLSAFNFDNVLLFEEDLELRISEDELHERKIDPELKKKMRRKIFLEAVADVILPTPLQLGYHAYQMITLKEF
ncbi:MAG: hypothetical protein K6F39_05950 [Lachnospiraceae bacterium]|nr:hypothetical protein [Lachnospiraceae bacterium]